MLADILHSARKSDRRPDASSAPDMDYHEALAVQLDVLKRFTEDGEALAGWKVGLSTGKARDAFGAGFRPFGYIRGPNCLGSGARVEMAPIVDCRIEPELCVVMGAPLKGGDVTLDQARAAVRALAPAFEINSVRVGMRENPALFIADGLANWGIVVGPEIPVSAGEIAPQVSLFRDDELLDRSAPDLPADGPFLALARLCAVLHAYGLGVEEGQRIITGSFSQDRVTRPARYRAEFDRMGTVEVEFV